jgi:glycosyltransferase involved in cell wall biosynthesis
VPRWKLLGRGPASGPRLREYKAVRLLPELRSFHLEMAEHFPDVLFVYFSSKYDAPETHDRPNVVASSPLRALWILQKTRVDVLEMWEPLWVRCLPMHGVITTLWKLLRGPRRAHVVSYAMENNDFSSLALGRGGSRVAKAALPLLRVAVGGYVRLVYAKLAYAGPQSVATYHSLPWVSQVPSQVFPDLPGRPTLAPSESSRAEQVALRCVFVGRLEVRKGIGVLFDAWRELEARLDDAEIMFVGGGPMASAVAAFVGDAPDRRTYAGELSHVEALSVLPECDVLVLPSIRDGRWREQTGLPIREALQRGLTVVTTTETGLAAWLSDHGHQVVGPGDSSGLATALESAINAPLDRRAVAGSLPLEDGEYVATRWLHGRGTAAAAQTMEGSS